MRNQVLPLLFVLAMGVGFCQPAGEKDIDGVVEQALNPKSIAIYTGVWEKQLNRYGDAAAVSVTKILRDKDIPAEEIDRILKIIYSAFAAPAIVEVKSDRQPRTTLLVLRYLDACAKEPELKKKIAATRGYVQDQYDKLKKDESEKKK